MSEIKSAKLNFDAKPGNKIELIDGTEVKTLNTAGSKKTIRLGRKTGEGHSLLKIENYKSETKPREEKPVAPNPPKTSGTVNPNDMLADLELIGNEETRNQVAAIRDGEPNMAAKPKPSRETASNASRISGKASSGRGRRVPGAQAASPAVASNVAISPPPPVKATASPTIDLGDVGRQRHEIEQINQQLNFIHDKNDPDVRSNASSRIMNFSPAFSSKHGDLNIEHYSKMEIGGASEPKKRLSTREIYMLKTKELLKLERLKKRGYAPSRHYSIVDNYDDICAERTRLEEMANLESGIQFQKNGMLFFSSFLEMANSQYNNVFDLNLNGWSDSLHDNIENFDPVFEELYEKYKESVQVAPEIKLVMMFFGSAISYHFSQQLLKKAENSIPGFRDVMSNNPGLKKAYTDTAAQMFARNMGAKQQQQPAADSGGDMGGMFGMLGNMFGMGGGDTGPRVTSHSASRGASNGVQLKEPADFDDLLRDSNLSHLAENSIKIDDDLTSYVSNNNRMRNVQMASSKRAVKRG